MEQSVVLAVWGLAKEDKLLEAFVFGFRGWPVNPNLIFGDCEIRLRPQMEVWFCAIAGTDATCTKKPRIVRLVMM